MLTQSTEEKEFFEKQKTYATVEERAFYDFVSKLTDRELQEKKAYYLWQLEKSNTRIKLNLQFWFYFALIGGFLTAFVLFNLKK